MNRLNNYERGSVTFILYFIIIISILAGAAFIVGLREHNRLNPNESSNNNQTIFDDLTYLRETGAGVESPLSVLKSTESKAKTIGGEIGLNSNLIEPESNSEFNTLMSEVKNMSFAVSINHADGVNFNDFVKLENGVFVGDDCYNEENGKSCFPKYRLGKVISSGDINGDGYIDAVIPLIVTEKQYSKSERPIYYLVLSTGVDNEIENIRIDAEKYSPKIVSINIDEENKYIIMVGTFHDDKDPECCPTLDKMVKLKLSGDTRIGYKIAKVGEAKLFKEQGENVNDWQSISAKDLLREHIDYTYYIPRNWTTSKTGGSSEHNFNIYIDTKRTIKFSVNDIYKTCPEYQIEIGNSNKIRKAQYININDTGDTGLYLQYEAGGDYYTEVCIADKTETRKVLSFKVETKEIADTYFVMLDKIVSTLNLKINQFR